MKCLWENISHELNVQSLNKAAAASNGANINFVSLSKTVTKKKVISFSIWLLINLI